MARIRPKMNSDKLLMTVKGSLAAKAVVVKQPNISTSAAYTAKARLLFLLIGRWLVSLFCLLFLLNSFILRFLLELKNILHVLIGQKLIGGFRFLHIGKIGGCQAAD